MLKNIHLSIDIKELKTANEELGFQVTNIWNVKSRETKKPLPFFFIDLKPNPDNKQIYKITHLMHCLISFEAPKSKHDI